MTSFCPNCGQQLSNEMNFCPSCGKSTQVNNQQESVTNHNSTTNSGFWIFLGIISALVAVFYLPPLFGGLGVFFGYRAKENNNSAGGIAIMVISGACMLMGMFIGAMTFS